MTTNVAPSVETADNLAVQLDVYSSFLEVVHSIATLEEPSEVQRAVLRWYIFPCRVLK